MTSTVNIKKFNYEVNTFISDAEARKKFHKALDDFSNGKNIIKFTNELKDILDRPERLRMYDVLRPLIPLRQQMEYNMLVPYINNKQRTIQLRRRKGVTSFGFAIRGGREHGIGVFVSEVDEGSEASRQGLKVGDEIIAVNGLNIDQAIHEEVLNLMNKGPRNNILELAVRSVGMIPVKNWEDASPDIVAEHQRSPYFLSTFISSPAEIFDSNLQSPSPQSPDTSYPSVFTPSPLASPSQLTSLTPLVFAPPSKTSTSSVSSQRSLVLSPSSPLPPSLSYEQLLGIGRHRRNNGALSWRTVTPKEWPKLNTSGRSTNADNFQDVKAYLTFQPNQKFGCNICKGPPDRPGIYIQSTTEGGLAHQVGLQTGDKLLEANAVDLQNMEFSEAVNYLKSCKYVELVVRRGVGVDLFPGESSGYNSSSSSTVGDHSHAVITTEQNEMTTMTDATDSGGPRSTNNENANEVHKIDAPSQKTAIVNDVVADVIVHNVENRIVGEMINGIENNVDLREDERRRAAVFRYQHHQEELERKKKEAEEEKHRHLEYISRKEVENIEEEFINKGKFRRDSLLLQRHRSSSMELIQDDALNRIKEEEYEEGTINGIQDQEVLQRMESTEKMVRTAEVLMDKALSRSSSNSSGGDSGLHMKEEAKENDINENDKWKKTVLAEIHNTPRPTTTNEDSYQDRIRKISQISQSSQSQFSTLESNNSSDISKERRNEMQKRSQHDQVIEEFRQTHKKMFALALEKNKNLAQQGEKEKEIIIDIREMNIWQKPAPLQQTSSSASHVRHLRFGNTRQPPTGNPAAHKFVETPQIGKVTRDPMQFKTQGAMFPPPKTPIFGVSITDSVPVAPRPPEFYYPEAKPKVVINPYVSSNARPAPKRLEYLEHHPSVATVEFKLNDPPKKARATPPELPKINDVTPTYVTKVLINKPKPKPTLALIIKKPSSPAATVNVMKTVPKPIENEKNNLNNGTETKAVTNGNPASSERIGFNTARLKFMNGSVAPSVEKPRPALSNIRAMSPAIQNTLFKFQNIDAKPVTTVGVNGVNGGTKYFK